MVKSHDPIHKNQYTIALNLATLAKACHLRIDDAAFALAELGFLRHRRGTNSSRRSTDEHELGEWKDVEVVVSRETVEEMWRKWRIREKGVLAEECMLL